LIYETRKNGKRRSNLNVAIKHWLEALKGYRKSKYHDIWAKIHQHLALSYGALIQTVDPAASSTQMSEEEFAEQMSKLVEKWIASCTNALQYSTPTNDAMDW
jgi:hypothetical protein